MVNRWFVARRGFVSGLLTAASATGQLIFLPLVAWIAESTGWRAAALTVSGAAVAVVPLVVALMRDRPSDLGVLPYGGTAADVTGPIRAGAARIAVDALRTAARTRTFWLLAGGFFVCGATTAGLVQSHFVPAAHDHGMPATTAAGLLALVGVFDLVGTVCSGWLTDRYDPRVLLAVYYGLRAVSLALLPLVWGTDVDANILAFVVFYGLDWVATVPPTMALAREAFGSSAAVVFGWVFAAHQLGAAFAAGVAGLVRDALGSYDTAWFGGAVLCVVAVGLSLAVRRRRSEPAAAPV